MEVENNIDGMVADWEVSDDDRCICDIRATFVTKLLMSKVAFHDGLVRLKKRRAMRSEFILRKLSSRQPGLLHLVDENVNFQVNDDFEEIFDREPLDAFIIDMEEVAHQYLGDFFSQVRSTGLSVSPVNAGKAIKITPSRSFIKASDCACWDEEMPNKVEWSPCVRTELNFLIAGPIGIVGCAQNLFINHMSDIGIMFGFETSIRKPNLENIPHVNRSVRLAPSPGSWSGVANKIE